MLELNDLLQKAEIDPSKVIVMRHRPTERDLRKALMWLAAERHDVYNHYQRLHGPKVEASLARASHVVSCIGHTAGKAVFVGIYRVDGWDEMSAHKWATMKHSQALTSLGDRGPRKDRQILRRSSELTHLRS